MEREKRIYPCNVAECSHAFTNLRRLIAHLRNFHNSEKKVEFACGVHHCVQKFSKFETFRKHLHSAHHALWVQGARDEQSTSFVGGDQYDADVLGMDFEDTTNESKLVEPQKIITCEEAYSSCVSYLEEKLTKLRLKLAHTIVIPASAVKEVMEDITNVIKEFKNNLTQCVRQRLIEMEVSDNFLDFVLCDSVSFDRTVKYLSRQQDEQLFKNLGYVAPVECFPETPECNDSADEDDCSVSPSGKKKSYQYVPILESIKSYLSHADVVESIKKEEYETSAACFRKMTCGSHVRNHELFSHNPNCLRVMLYTDEFGICSTIGPHQTAYKHCGVYFSIDNIESTFATSQSSIFLAVLASYDLIVKYSYHVILQPLITDLKILETAGVTVTVADQDHHFLGGLAAVLGDNLSQHSIGMFNKRFNGGLVCRTCMIDYDDLRNALREEDCILRNELTHNLHVEAVKKDSSLSSVYGVTGEACFSSLLSYKPILSLPPDEFHNNAFGFLENNLVVVTRGLIGEKVISLDFLNELINAFPFQRNDKVNKVVKITKTVLSSSSLQGTGAEREHLFRMLSLIAGPHISHDNVYWKLHLLADRITDILMAPVIPRKWIQHLRDLIYEYLKLWSSFTVKPRCRI